MSILEVSDLCLLIIFLAAPTAPSNIFILIQLYHKTKQATVKNAVLSLLSQSLKDSLLFLHNVEELRCWLDSLPVGTRKPGIAAPDGTLLTDEYEAVIPFLDECMQRCAKTPHRYLEGLHLLQNREPLEASHNEMIVEDRSSVGNACAISPLIITVLEQFDAKSQNSRLSASDLLALTTFMRIVVTSLLGNQNDMRVCWAIQRRLKSIIAENTNLNDHPSIFAAMQREASILASCISRCISQGILASDEKRDDDLRDSIPDFITHLDCPGASTTHLVRFLRSSSLAFADGNDPSYLNQELADWLRLSPHSPTENTFEQIIEQTRRTYSLAIAGVLHFIIPGTFPLSLLKNEDSATS